MTLTLYRKYRPQSYSEVVGQNHIKTTIQNELETSKVAHAYLFSGPRGLGKTTMARLLAKAVNCLNRKSGESEPCNQCEACQELMAGRSLDIIEIDAASHTGVDNVRENIINNSRFTPTSRKYKVFIIDEVHMLSISAFNALLKTLEEPPEHAIFILATTEIHKVPQTIISRCQHFEFRKVSRLDVINRLNYLLDQEKRRVDKKVIEDIAIYSQGSIRDAESLLGQILSLSKSDITAQQAELVLPKSRFDSAIELVSLINKNDAAKAIILINKLLEDGIDLEKFTIDLIEVIRKILLIKINGQLGELAVGLNKDLEKEVINLAQDIKLDLLIKMIEVFLMKKQELKFSDIIQLPLEIAILEIINQPEIFAGNKESGKPDDLPPLADNKTPEADIKKPPMPGPEVKTKNTIGKVKISLGQVKEKWNEVLICLKKYNHSLASTLKLSQPSLMAEDGTLEICLTHKFHQQRINEIKNRQILEKVLQEIFGTQLIVKTVVVKELPDQSFKIEALTEEVKSNPIDDLVKAFGGQVID
jgi:DNA polymerase-3 subunit gamma/tau